MMRRLGFAILFGLLCLPRAGQAATYYVANHVRTDTGGEFIFAGASILTNRVFRHLPNPNCADF